MKFPNITYAFLFAGATFGSRLCENSSPVNYTQNWAGAALNGNGYTSVSGTITVPSFPSNFSYSGGGGAWVGIDGFDDCPTILQTGIGWIVEEDGNASYKAWSEWFPAPSGMLVNPRYNESGDYLS